MILTIMREFDGWLNRDGIENGQEIDGRRRGKAENCTSPAELLKNEK